MNKETKNQPKWKDRFKKNFGGIINTQLRHMRIYDADMGTGANSKPLSVFLEEFMDTVYKEGLRDGKGSS